MLRKPLVFAALALGACSHAPAALVSAPILTEATFSTAGASAPKNKAELQKKIFDAALESLQSIADSEHGILRKDEKGWSVINPNTEEDLNAVWGNAKSLYVAGSSGTILRSTNDGVSWKKLSSGVSANLNKLWGVDAEVVYAVGDRGTILRSNNSGDSWDRQSSGTKVNLHSVWGFSAKEVYAVGEGGVILATQDGGKTWTPQASNISTALFDVWGQSNTKLFVVGEKGVILRSFDQGKLWDKQSPGVDVLLTAVRGSESQGVYVSGIGGTILHLHSDGAWKIESGFRLGGYSLEDAYWSREDNPVFSAFASSGDSIFAIGGGRLWTARSERERNQATLPLFPGNSERVYTVASPRFQGVWAPSSSKLIVVGPQWHLRLLRQTKEAIDLADWSDVAFHLESVKEMYPERYELSAAYSLALLLANDDAASYLAKKTLMTFPKPARGNPTLTDELAAALWFFIGEAQGDRGSPKLAQASYLMSQWILPSEFINQRISKGPCVAEINEKPTKPSRYQGWAELHQAIHKSDKKDPTASTPSEAQAKKELCAQEPSGCGGAGPWLLKTTRRALSGKEEAMLSLAFPEQGGKLLGLTDLYHAPIDHTGIGEALLAGELVIFKDGLAWLSIEGPIFALRGGEQTGLLQEERFFDTKGKRQVFSLSQKALIQANGQAPRIEREFLFPVEGKLEAKALQLIGGGCDRKIKL